MSRSPAAFAEAATALKQRRAELAAQQKSGPAVEGLGSRSYVAAASAAPLPALPQPAVSSRQLAQRAAASELPADAQSHPKSAADSERAKRNGGQPAQGLHVETETSHLVCTLMH